ncbi:antiviral RADAR system adenosine triphosphatase RdrA [Undibacterium rugosum]|uniref:antiviral RADAR system adenosine triphosphatase RdrA n=1 Tax=Undibacterium rugosum TaxID=2762291 RepID=UPI001B8243C1|nr:antiviral RADAR system adenosine triphosphatase RdrA [Undibacterium rugosum]MBR7777313.1 hypothetical protein [Undibacterium rugosum]
MSDNKENIIYFPVEQGEQARQPKAENLLARDVYKRIADLLERSEKKLNEKLDVELDDTRAHEAILIDGGRGTGKSSILVNLPLYLNQVSELKDKLLILKPVDPTLLEKDSNLFLDIIVAALLRDKQIKEALSRVDPNAEAFYEQLQRLGTALEGIQKQANEFGLDKLRAFIGNHGIADEVHKIFGLALRLTNKRLMVLPIDDVDTSLQHAFENLEVVRKYLASPYVVPIISGDLSLYRSVTWREFYGRITDKVKEDSEEAYRTANELAIEYQRKVLPLPRRLHVPDIQSYLDSENIVIVDSSNEPLVNVKVFSDWLRFALNGHINGFENSRQTLPIFSIRDFSQLVSNVQEEIRELADYLRKDSSERNELGAGEKGQYRFATESAFVGRFYNRKRSVDYLQALLATWIQPLEEYFQKNPDGGTVALVMNAMHNREKKRQDQATDSTNSILDLALFNPLRHKSEYWRDHCKIVGLRDSWGKYLATRIADETWIQSIPESTVLPYPVPELGVAGASALNVPHTKSDAITDLSLQNIEFVRRLIVYRVFYSNNQSGNLIFTGRLFELLILSLVRNVVPIDVQKILSDSPYYSSAFFAGTKMLNIDASDEAPSADEIDDNDLHTYIRQLTQDINSWRDEHAETLKLQPHAWLIYKVMNKFFTQLSTPGSWILDKRADNEKKYNSSPGLRYVADIGVRSFHAICAAFGSFELANVRKVSIANGTVAGKSFENTSLFNSNIKPFLSPESIRSYTGVLYQHPIKNILMNAYQALLFDNELEDVKNKETKKQTVDASTENAIKREFDKYLKSVFAGSGIKAAVVQVIGSNLPTRNAIFDEFKNRLTPAQVSVLPAIRDKASRSELHRFLKVCMPVDVSR